jgi:hypothetical protein
MLRPLMLTIFSHPPNREGLKPFSLLILVMRLKMDTNTLKFNRVFIPRSQEAIAICVNGGSNPDS